jgi:hypothetical protein
VVRSSDIYGRIACHLQNIELIEYGNIEKKTIDNDFEFIQTVEEFSKKIKSATPAVNEKRWEYLEKNIYEVFRELFKKYGIIDKWVNHRNYNTGSYWPTWLISFINKWYLTDQEISIGLFEDIMQRGDFSVCVSYYSPNEEKIKELKKLFEEKREYFEIDDIKQYDEDHSYLMNIRYDSEYFFQHVKEVLEFNLKKYLEINPIN